MFIITWNVLSETMLDQLCDKGYKCIKHYNRQLLLKTTLLNLLDTYPMAIVCLQEFGFTERLTCVNELQKRNYSPFGGQPENYTEVEEVAKYWKNIRENMSVVIFVPKQYKISGSGTFNLANFVPKQNENVIFNYVTNYEGKKIQKTVIEDLTSRVILVSWVLIHIKNLNIIVANVQHQYINNMPMFQAISLEAQKNIAKKLLGLCDICVFVGDYHFDKNHEFTNEPNELWTSFISGKQSKSLPKHFIGNDINVSSYDNQKDDFISYFNGVNKSNPSHIIVYSDIETRIESINTESMTESGPNIKYSSDNIPLLFKLCL